MNILALAGIAALALAFELIGIHFDRMGFAMIFLFIVILLIVVVATNLETLKIPRIRDLDLRRPHEVRRMGLRDYLDSRV